MKYIKTFLIFCVFIFSASIVSAKDFEMLYSIKNVNSENVKNTSDFYARQRNMKILKSDISHSVIQIKPNHTDYYFTSFEKSGDDTLFYIYIPNDSSYILKDILKRFKTKNYKYSKVLSKDMLKLKNENAKLICKPLKANENSEIINKNISNSYDYDFSDEAQKIYNSNINPNANYSGNMIQNQIVPIQSISLPEKWEFSKSKTDTHTIQNNNYQISNKPEINIKTEVPLDTYLTVILQSSINTSSLEKSDRIAATLKDDLYLNNTMKAEKGSIVYGSALSAQKAGWGYKNGALTINFDKILTLSGEELEIKTDPLVFENNSNTNRGAKIAGTVTGGVLLGIAGAAISSFLFNSSNKNWGRTLSSGAIIGALGSGFVVMSANGEEIELKEGQELKFKLNSIH